MPQLFIFLFLLFFSVKSTRAQTPDTEWNMAGANPARTSSITTNISAITSIDWYRPIEAYIDQKTQIITANKKIYVATTKGLLVLHADTGDLAWRFDTELPLAHSPTVIGDMVYIGGFDRKLYALRDLGNSFSVVWIFSIAKSGYSASPLVVNDTVYIGNRDGRFYAVDATTGNLKWQFPTATQSPLQPILVSAAFDASRNTIYFASLNMRGYALNASTGASLWSHHENGQSVAGSERLPGGTIASWWPVVYKDLVIFSTSHPWGGEKSPNMDWRDQIYKPAVGTRYAGALVTSDGSQGWPANQRLLDAESSPYNDHTLQSYLTANPDQKTTISVSATTGQITTGNQSPPFIWSGTTNGNRAPPAISTDGEILYNTNTYSIQFSQNSAGQITGNIPRAMVMGWKFGNRYLQLVSTTTYAIDEPAIVSAAGSQLLFSLCCDRISANITGNRTFWSYGGTGMLDHLLPSVVNYTTTPPSYNPNQPNAYDTMWSMSDSALERLKGYYVGNRNTPNGVYSSHGLQNPLVPYVFTNTQGQTVERLFVHRSNAIIALGTAGSKTALPPIAITTPHTEGAATGISQSELVPRLEAEILKIITAWENDPNHRFLNPGYYNNGQWFSNNSITTDYFTDPGETVLSLSQAYPYINNTELRQRLTNYLSAYTTYHFIEHLYSHIGFQGISRNDMIVPPSLTSAMSSSPPTNGFKMRNYYSLWKYILTLPTASRPATARALYDATSSQLRVTTNPTAGTIVPLTQEQWLHKRTWEVNEHIMAYQGFLNLQAIALNNTYTTSQQTTRTSVQNAVNDLINLRRRVFFKDTSNQGSFDNPNGLPDNLSYRKLNLSRNFLFMTPELAADLRAAKLSEVGLAVEEYTYLAPFWFGAHIDNDYKESAVHHLYDRWALIAAKSLILGEPVSELTKFIDIPAFPRGDLQYIDVLSTILLATNTPQNSPLPTIRPSLTPTPSPAPTTPSPSPVPGDANGDGRVTLADYAIWVSRYLQNITGSSNADFNNSGKIDGMDYILWLKSASP